MKYRIEKHELYDRVQYYPQYKFLWFWINLPLPGCKYYCKTLEEASDRIERDRFKPSFSIINVE